MIQQQQQHQHRHGYEVDINHFFIPEIYTRTYAHIYYYSDKRATTKENWQLRAAVHATSLRVCGCVSGPCVYNSNLHKFISV